MDKLLKIQTFIAVAEEEGFAPAARKLSMSPPAVTRAISALEQELSVKLFNRTTRFVRLTDAGSRYLEDCRVVLEKMNEADEAARGINSEPQGHIAITAPVMFGRMFVMPSVVSYLKQNPKTSIDAIFLDRVVNMLEEGIDLGVRIGELPDSSMHAIRVGSVRQIICASPKYFEIFGIPQSPSDLLDHQLIVSKAGGFKQNWQFNIKEKTSSIKVKPRLTVSNNDSAIEAAKSGFGICRLLSYQIAPELMSNQLKIALENFERKPLPVHIVHREGRMASIKVRAFVDELAESLKANPVLN